MLFFKSRNLYIFEVKLRATLDYDYMIWTTSNELNSDRINSKYLFKILYFILNSNFYVKSHSRKNSEYRYIARIYVLWIQIFTWNLTVVKISSGLEDHKSQNGNS